MNRFFSDTLEALQPYVPGEQPQGQTLLKLNTNEHPYGPSPLALQAIREAATDQLRLYPDPQATALCEAAAGLYGLKASQVFVGNGSDEVLAHVFRALFQREGVLLMPDITYSFYESYCALFQVRAHTLALADDFTITVSDYTAAPAQPLAGIIIANPNAPTGMALSLDDIARIAGAHPDVAVVIDEAYVDFGAQSATRLLDSHDNLLVVQTLSKSRALAGLRVGFAFASQAMVAGLERVKNSFNSYPLDRLAQAGALASILDQAHFEQSCRAVIAAREELSGSLRALGFQVLPSQTNFVFARHPRHKAAALAAGLRGRGILVRHFARARISEFLRISVGRPEECRQLCAALEEIMNKPI